MTSTRAAIAGAVRAEMARKGISGRQLAADLDIPVHYLQRRLAGSIDFGATELVTIADHLGIPVTRFYEEPDRDSDSGSQPPRSGRGAA